MDANFSLSSQSWSTTVEAASHVKRSFYPLLPEIAIPVSIADVLAVLVGTTTNLLVMTMIVKYRHTMQHMDLLIFNLCLSDFLCSVFIQPQIILRLLVQEEGSDIETLLRTIASFTFLSAGCSSLFLVTLDRYLSVRYPFHYSSYVNKSKVYFCLGCTWFVSWVIGLLPSFDVVIAFQIYVGYSSIVIGLTITLQISAFRIARAQETRIRQLEKSVSHNYQGPDSETYSDERRKNQAQMKSTKTIIILFVFFVSSWLPATLFYIYYGIKQDRKLFFTYLHVFNATLQLNVCINPFIYVFRTRRVRTKFLKFRQKILSGVHFLAARSMGTVS